MTEKMNGGAYSSTRRLVESALMVAIATVLSLVTFSGFWALGGGVTLASMTPLVIISYRYGCGWGMVTAFVYSLLQMLLGIQNVQYASTAVMAAGIVLLDYVIAFTAVGASAMFKGRIANERVGIAAGVVVTLLIRFVCHFLSGWIIWEALWPNEAGMAPMAWSLYYNASYMIPETIITVITSIVAVPLTEKL